VLRCGLDDKSPIVNEVDCSICLAQLTNYALKCNHIFCMYCLEHFFNKLYLKSLTKEMKLECPYASCGRHSTLRWTEGGKAPHGTFSLWPLGDICIEAQEVEGGGGLSQEVAA
jgi:hypothetical protein